MTWGLVVTAFSLGLRHGVDWDHIAAIADLSGSAGGRRRGFVLSLLYAVGHGIVVFALGAVAIAFGAAIPASVEAWMGRVVGATLVLLGCWVLIELVRRGRDFRLRSRWMLIIGGAFAGIRRVRSNRSGRAMFVEHDHPHSHDDDDEHDHSHRHQDRHRQQHRHPHTHSVALPNRADGYANTTATGIGMLHGIGVESPTQIAVFVASSSVLGAQRGFVLLAAWVVGLILANSALALLAGFGLLHAERNYAIYATLAVIVAVGSIGMGALFLGGWELLPEIDLVAAGIVPSTRSVS